LEDRGDGSLPCPRPYSTHPHLRPTVKRGIFDNPYAHLPGEQPCKDLEHDDLMALYGYDEERGLSQIILENGTKIEIPIEDEQGAITWIAGVITSIQEGSLDFQVIFRGSAIDSGTWRQTRNRAEMEATWRLSPALRRRQPSVHIILTTPWHHPYHGSYWLRLYVRGGTRARGIQTRLDRPSNPPRRSSIMGGIDKPPVLPNTGKK